MQQGNWAWGQIVSNYGLAPPWCVSFSAGFRFIVSGGSSSNLSHNVREEDRIIVTIMSLLVGADDPNPR
jgi:hypothetical protein